MNKIISVLIKDENYEFEVVIKKVTQEELTKAKKFANRSTYVNPSKLRIGALEQQEKYISTIDFQNYCPV